LPAAASFAWQAPTKCGRAINEAFDPPD
jgi:hypothetical protein